jgi:hypothetical protein
MCLRSSEQVNAAKRSEYGFDNKEYRRVSSCIGMQQSRRHRVRALMLIRISAQIDNESIDAACAVRHILFEAVQYARKEKLIKKSPERKSDSADLSPPAQIEPGDPDTRHFGCIRSTTNSTSNFPILLNTSSTSHSTGIYCFLMQTRIC